jgi:succinate dehydrogenase / fumarate reductase cytochrome b subunit
MGVVDRHFWHRKIHSLLGVIPIGAFLIVHLVTNYYSTRGPEAFNEKAGLLEDLPFLLLLEIFLIYLPIIYHAGYGVFIAFQAKHNLGNFGYFRNWMFFVQRITGIISLIFIAWHVWQTRINLFLGNPPNFQDMANLLSNPVTYVLYVIGLLCVVFHFSNGLWSFLVHWGIAVGPRAQRITTYATMVVFVLVSAIGLASLNGFVSADAANQIIK